MPADTQITIYGLGHLAGKTVTAYIAGLDCGDYTVAVDGSIIVLYGSDVGGLMTPAYLIATSGTYGGSNHDVTFNVNPGSGAVSVTVPILCGLNYYSHGQIVRPEASPELKLQTGAGFGVTRRGYEYTLLVQNCVTLQVGTELSQTLSPGTDDTTSTLSTSLFTSDGGRTPELALTATQPFTGVHWGVLQDEYTFDSMLAWQIDRPSPGSVLAAGIFLGDEDR